MKTNSGSGKRHTRSRLIAKAGACLALSLCAPSGWTQTSGTSLQVYGVIGLYLDRLERSNMDDSLVQLGHGGLTTSFIGFRGSEDLGGGTKAIFALESFFQSDTGAMGRNASDGLFSRNAYVGFSTRYGSLTLGRQTNPTYAAMGMLSPFGASVVFSPLVVQTFIAPYGGAIIGDTVWNNTIQYVTPNFNGFTGTVVHGLGEIAGRPGISNTGLHVKYAKGPLSGAVSVQRNRTAAVAPSDAQYTWLAGAAYDFRVAKVFGSTVRTSANVTELKTRTYDLGVSVPVSPAGAVWLEWARTAREAPGVADTRRNTASLAYNHVLSKRTNAYVVYSRDKLTDNPWGDTYGVGIRHTF
ncbi:MAG: porin [Noviherbaspirillum sp.]